MSWKKKHTIEKVVLEVQTSNDEAAQMIKNDSSSFLQYEVFPLIEKLFDEYGNGEHTQRFKKISINVKIGDWNNKAALKQDLIYKLKGELEKSMLPLPSINSDSNLKDKHSNVETVSAQEKHEELFLYFIENGHLPWHSSGNSLQNLMSVNVWDKMLENSAFLEKLMHVFRKSGEALKRMIFQLSAKQNLQFLIRSNVVQLNNSESFAFFLNQRSWEQRKVLLLYLLNTSIYEADNAQIEVWKHAFYQKYFAVSKTDKTNGENSETLDTFITESKLDLEAHFSAESFNRLFELNNSASNSDKHNPKNVRLKRWENDLDITSFDTDTLLNVTDFANEAGVTETTTAYKIPDELYVKNAGMVLFHPFITRLFEKLNYTENKQIKPYKVQQAVQLLHYCATGETQFLESELLLEKFMCGVPISCPIVYNCLLKQHELFEAEEMLQVLIENWKELKKTSPVGLREMFIRREGKLMSKKNAFRLIIERKPQDILLDKLQWSTSIVKLPWLDKVLFVEW